MENREGREQQALMEWAGWMQGHWPELALLYHIPNGGSRHKAEAAKLKAQGVKAGVPDLCLPVARGGYHGLYIELKALGGRVSSEQRVWLQMLEAQGYRAAVCRGFEEARVEIERYLKGKAREVGC